MRHKIENATRSVTKALSASSGALQAFFDVGASYFNYSRFTGVRQTDGTYMEASNATYAQIYATQENVRIVVDAVARYAAKRYLKCFQSSDIGGGQYSSQEDPEFIAAENMEEPNDWMTQSDLLDALFKDKLIYEDAYLWDMGPNVDGTRFLLRVPPYAMAVKSSNQLIPTGYEVRFADGRTLDLTGEEVFHWRGYSPGSNRIGVSKLETLRVLLLENSARKSQMIDTIRGGLIKGGIVKRPLEAPEWSSKARQRFEMSFASRLRGVSKGEVAMLEDGMEFMEAGITPREAELLASKQFDLVLCCNIYGINPALFEAQGNLSQAREMMDEDVVEPMACSLADALTKWLIRGKYADDTHYFKFKKPPITDVAALFVSSSNATGGAVMTPNEFREEYLDMPAHDAGDELVQHPGATQGGNPPAVNRGARGGQSKPAADRSPATAPQKVFDALRAKEIARTKALARHANMRGRRSRYARETEEVIAAHFDRQKASISGGR